MSEPPTLPEPDKLEGAPHPRETTTLFGQAEAEAEFLAAFAGGRLHHGWLLTGPRGVGKATLAWSIARFLLATPEAQDDGLFGAPPPPQDLAIDPEHPVARRVRALSEPGLFLLRRGPTDKGDALASMLLVKEVRKLQNFFAMSAPDGGRRVVIVDAADELNPHAANALLKMLEEPPARTTMLLIAHQPAGLLPTIRSRCRTLRLSPLGSDDMTAALDQAGVTVAPDETMALTALAGGSVGAAIGLLQQDGLALYRDVLMLLASLPALDRPRLLTLAESCAGKGREARLAQLLALTDQLCTRIARSGALGVPPEPQAAEDEARILMRLCPDAAAARRWAGAAQAALDRARHARSVNIDPAALVTDMFLHLSRAA